MLITFGDSFTYGFNFNESEREHSVYPSIIGKSIEQDVLNMALPGGSNWRVARQLQSIPLSQEDTVIISWSIPNRFEWGVSPSHTLTPITEGHIGDLVEKSGDLITKRFFEQLTDRTTDKEAKTLNELIYGEFNNDAWFGEMFKVMYSSCVHILEQSQCKWCMFNAWAVQASGNYHKNYLYSDRTLSDIVKADGYWNKEQHKQVAQILMEELNKIYG